MKTEFSLRTGRRTATASARPDGGFREPPMLYAPFAFWFWNAPDELADPDHFARMAAEMSRQGLNPGDVHARYYREGEPFWLTEDWYRCFDASLASTAGNGTYMSYTMGDPSFPDKYILPDHPELKAVSLAWSVRNVEGGKIEDVSEALFSVAARRGVDGRLLSATLKLVDPDAEGRWRVPPEEAWCLYSFTGYTDHHRGDGKPINFLDRRITQPWLELENAGYDKRFSSHFGKTMPGVFFDLEGSFGYKIAWSEDLAADYLKRKGVDIRLRMPLLIEEDAEGLWAKARWDWFDSVGRVFAECLFAPLDRWCRERGMFMTCHFWEESLFKQAVETGNFMGAQRAYSMPGTDALFHSVHDPRYFKETQSVCEFEGRPFMCEVLGVAGWHLTTSELKAAANASIAHGLTHVILHGVDSSPKLEKVSYPPDFYHWNPYWRFFRQWTDFVRRGCYLNDHGHLDAKVLLLCPMDSVWALIGDAYFDPEKPHHEHIENERSVEFSHAMEVGEIDEVYTRAIREMSAARIDHLVADSHYIMDMDARDGVLSHGPFSFRAIVLPPLKLLPLEAARRIVEFARGGGRVHALGALPDASAEAGVGDPELAGLMEDLRQAAGFHPVTDGWENAIRQEASGLDPCVRFESGEFPLLATKRIINGRGFFWLANNEDTRRECELILPGAAGEVSLWHPESGETRRVGSRDAGGGSRVSLVFEPHEGFWLVHDPSRSAVPFAHPSVVEKVLCIEDKWNVSIDAGDQPELAQHRLAAPEWLLEGGASRPLESWLKWGLRAFTGFVDYETTFHIERVAGTEELDLGCVKHIAEVRINGLPAGARMWAPFTFRIGERLRPGANSIRIRVGNLILNAVTQYQDYKWKWYQPPDDAALDCGLFGPVRILRSAPAGRTHNKE